MMMEREFIITLVFDGFEAGTISLKASSTSELRKGIELEFVGLSSPLEFSDSVAGSGNIWAPLDACNFQELPESMQIRTGCVPNVPAPVPQSISVHDLLLHYSGNFHALKNALKDAPAEAFNTLEPQTSERSVLYLACRSAHTCLELIQFLILQKGCVVNLPNGPPLGSLPQHGIVKSLQEAVFRLQQQSNQHDELFVGELLCVLSELKRNGAFMGAQNFHQRTALSEFRGFESLMKGTCVARFVDKFADVLQPKCENGPSPDVTHPESIQIVSEQLSDVQFLARQFPEAQREIIQSALECRFDLFTLNAALALLCALLTFPAVKALTKPQAFSFSGVSKKLMTTNQALSKC